MNRPQDEERPDPPARNEPEIEVDADETSVDDLPEMLDRLAMVEQELAEVGEKWKRALAETENVRRIAARDREDAGKYAVTRFARDMLSVADNLRRALDSMDKDARRTDPGLDALASGVELTERELLATFARHGISLIAAAGEPFDPHVHEALFEVPDESVPHGTVVHVLEPGYMIHDRPLRPTRVGVSRGGPKAAAQPAGADDGAPADVAAADGDGGSVDERA